MLNPMWPGLSPRSPVKPNRRIKPGLQGFHDRCLGASGLLLGGRRVGQPPEAHGFVMAPG